MPHAIVIHLFVQWFNYEIMNSFFLVTGGQTARVVRKTAQVATTDTNIARKTATKPGVILKKDSKK